MGLFNFKFRKKETIKESRLEKSQSVEQEIWREISPYIEAEQEKFELVSLIASTIAAGEQRDSQFVVKNISKRNPEVRLVSIIAASLAAVVQPDSRFRVYSIKENKQ